MGTLLIISLVVNPAVWQWIIFLAESLSCFLPHCVMVTVRYQLNKFN